MKSDRLERILENLGKVRLAHEAVMLNDANQTLHLNREGLRAHHQKMHGTPPKPSEEMIHLGDVHNSTTSTPPPAERSRLEWLPILLGTLGGAGTVLGALSLLGMLGKPSPTAAPAPQSQEFRVDVWVEEGGLKTNVTPVPVPK